MTDSVDDLTVKTEKLEIDSKFDANWCDLPSEIKLECIKPMDFKMRFQLRCTAHGERELVDSLRYQFDSMELGCDDLKMNNFNDPKKKEEYKFNIQNTLTMVDGIPKLESDVEKLILFLAYSLNKCDIGTLVISFYLYIDQLDFEKLNSLLEPESIRMKRLYLDDIEMKHTLRILKKCWKNAEYLKIDIHDDKIPAEEVFTVPSVINARKILYINREDPSNIIQVFPLIEEWIENDVDIGTRIEMCNFNLESANQLLSKLENRKISKNYLATRIRTDNAKKHILVSTENNGYDWSFFCCLVISSDLDQFQYENEIYFT